MTSLDIAGLLGAWRDTEVRELLSALLIGVADEDEFAAANFANDLRVLAKTQAIAYEALHEFARSIIAPSS